MHHHSATEVAETAEKSGGRSFRSIALPVILVIVGVLVLLYPVVATQWNNAKHQRAAAEYSRLESGISVEKRNETLDRAHRYNEMHGSGPILDPWLARISEDNADYQAYLKELNQFDAMGRLIVPAASVDLPIYHGTSEKSLQRGVGHLYGSDLPVGGEGTHSVLTAHTGLPNATLFDNLNKVNKGDVFYISVSGQKMKYQVESTEIVLPEKTESLKAVPGRDLVTLVTCTPYGINTHRLLVHGTRVPMDPEDEAAFSNPKTHWQWWMWALLVAAVVVLAVLIYWARKALKGEASGSSDEADEAAEAEEYPADATRDTGTGKGGAHRAAPDPETIDNEKDER